MTNKLTEDEVRQEAGKILNIDRQLPGAKSGVGQITTFNTLGFKGIQDKPDGWYLPNNHQDVALILETKSESVDLNAHAKNELLKNINIVNSKYKKVVGILYNGRQIIIYKNMDIISNSSTNLENIDFYKSLFNPNKIDKNHIFKITAKINNSLKFNFGIDNLYHRMIFTACTLVAKRYGALMSEGMDYSTFQNSIRSTLDKELIRAKKQNQKLGILLDVFADIKMNLNVNVEDEKEQERVTSFIDDFISWVSDISDSINSDYWNGEDVMGIFFNEFNRYKKKSEKGQIFTPEHITDFMYHIINCNDNDLILDATCGSGGFLVKAMSNMIKSSGGIHSKKAKQIKSEHLYGIEFDRQIYALACANMLIHKDGKTNLEQMDSRSNESSKWISSKSITKVLMNPPYENKYGCIDIVNNVLDSVPNNTIAAFILPDKKLEKVRKAKRILDRHTLLKIIKLPEKLFQNVGISTSIFVFKTGIPQNDDEIFSCYMPDDGLEVVKNQGRQDVNNKWDSIEEKWLDIINKRVGDSSIQWIKPSEHLSYQTPIDKFTVSTTDFSKTILNYVLFKNAKNLKDVKSDIYNYVTYNITMDSLEDKIYKLGRNPQNAHKPIETSDWSEIKLTDVFYVTGSTTTPKANLNLEIGGPYRYVTTASTNNGVSGYSEIETDYGNVITVDSATDGMCFYQSKSFCASDHVEKLIPKFDMDRDTALFIVTILNINASRYKYGYDEKRSQVALRKELIKLPGHKIHSTISIIKDINYIYSISKLNMSLNNVLTSSRPSSKFGYFSNYKLDFDLIKKIVNSSVYYSII